jgi:hypothetical protein
MFLLKENLHEFSKIKKIPFDIRKNIGSFLIESPLSVWLKLNCVLMKLNRVPDKKISLYNDNRKMDIHFYNDNSCDLQFHFLNFPTITFSNNDFFKDMEYEQFFSLLIYIIDTFQFKVNDEVNQTYCSFIKQFESRINIIFSEHWNDESEKHNTIKDLIMIHQLNYILHFSNI